MLYSSYIHSIISYGVIFSAISSDSIKIFRIQNKIIRINANLRNRIHVRIYFNNENITLLFTIHILSDIHNKQ
jgi:transposase-like protein